MEGSVSVADDLGAPPESWEVADLDASMRRLILSSSKKDADSSSSSSVNNQSELLDSSASAGAGSAAVSGSVSEDVVNTVDQFLREALQNPRERLSGLLCGDKKSQCGEHLTFYRTSHAGYVIQISSTTIYRNRVMLYEICWPGQNMVQGHCVTNPVTALGRCLVRTSPTKTLEEHPELHCFARDTKATIADFRSNQG
ncbi:hypothetical protein HAX54_027990 [Datura stramonium]|uniref:Uncharacterized protein n=1 Tax=Datura stramonium TaxID=4076 RepID=A0ABS8S963_DATST|nr:hypothetical protein [Datura stramonium]